MDNTKLFLDPEIDKDIDVLKEKKWKITQKLLFNVFRKNYKIASVSLFLAFFTAFFNFNFNNLLKKTLFNRDETENFFQKVDEEEILKIKEEILSKNSEDQKKTFAKKDVIDLIKTKESLSDFSFEKIKEYFKKNKSFDEKDFPIILERISSEDEFFKEDIEFLFKTIADFSDEAKKKTFSFDFNYIFGKIHFQTGSFPFFIFRFALVYLIMKAINSVIHIQSNKYISSSAEKDLKIDLFKRFINAKYENSSSMYSKVFTQISSTVEGISESIWSVPNRAVYVLFSISLQVTYELYSKVKEWKPTAIVLLLSLYVFSGLLIHFLLKTSTKKNIDSRRRLEEDNKFILERMKNLSHIKLSSSEELEAQKVEDQLNSSFLKNKSFIIWNGLLNGIPPYVIVPLVPFIAITIFYYFGGEESKKIGSIVGFYLTSRQITSELEKICNSLISLDSLFSDLTIVTESIYELSSNFVKNEEVQSLSKKDFSENGNISVEKLSFAYPLRPWSNIIQNLSFEFKKGIKYGISGKNGAGKSTITKIILKLFDFESGNILIANKNIKSLFKRSIHDQVCRLTNSPSFFNMTIAENVFYPYVDEYKSLSKKEAQLILEKAAKKAKIFEFINSLPFKFETVIRESGIDLSEGQKQQIEAMKVFVKEYEMYMFDEILSNVHPETRKLMLENIFIEVEGKTVIAIDHHYEIFKHMDEIYEFSREKFKKVSLESLKDKFEGESDEETSERS